MRRNKKVKLEKLNLYIIENDYINFLSKYDRHVAYNKNQKRPYIGVVIIVEKHHYFAPLFSPKQKHKMYKDNLTFFKIINEKTKKDLGIIRFSDMIPVPLECVNLINMKDKSYGYRRLLSEQYSCINKTENKQKILNKSRKIYNIVTNPRKSRTFKFYKELSCDFKLLEEKYIEYLNSIK